MEDRIKSVACKVVSVLFFAFGLFLFRYSYRATKSDFLHDIAGEIFSGVRALLAGILGLGAVVIAGVLLFIGIVIGRKKK